MQPGSQGITAVVHQFSVRTAHSQEFVYVLFCFM